MVPFSGYEIYYTIGEICYTIYRTIDQRNAEHKFTTKIYSGVEFNAGNVHPRRDRVRQELDDPSFWQQN